jgi:aspartyl-tRNA(Asn)/glutamyl-tRNA(Gln) amidotransferase subunit C
MAVTIKDVEYIADLARLKFSQEELEYFTKQLNQILEYMDKLNELDTDNVEPLSHPVEGTNVFREDKVDESISREEALKNAPDSDNVFFKVPKVIETPSISSKGGR